MQSVIEFLSHLSRNSVVKILCVIEDEYMMEYNHSLMSPYPKPIFTMTRDELVVHIRETVELIETIKVFGF